MILEVVLPIPLPKTFDYLIPSDFSPEEISEVVGKRVRVPFGRTFLTGVIWRVKESSEFPISKLKPFIHVIDDESILNSNMRKLAEWISIRYACSLGDAVFAMLPTSSSVPPEFHQVDSHISASPRDVPYPDISNVLHTAVYDRKNASFFLQSNRLSERMNVYFSVVHDVLSQHKSVLFLVPEIRLGAQIFQMLHEKFGDAVCFWNSENSRKEQDVLWWKLKRGTYSVVVGARSAVLLPLNDIGLIIMEDEPSAAYKEERRPRFHVRDVARERASHLSALCLMGGAMPSVQTFHDIIEKRTTQLLCPPRELTSAVSVRIVDMKTEGRKGRLSPVLKDALSQRLKLKQKSILFLNRKGTYKSVRCPKCPWVSPYDTKVNLPIKCPDCGHAKLRLAGFGTNTLVSEVEREFPWAKVVRWDAGLAQRENIPLDFDVLVGTELVTHGFHFPGVGLVGLVDADVSLRIPDFRAAEKTFQTLIHLLDQMEEHLVGAEMIIQTRHPDHDAFLRLEKKDVFGFFTSELKFRSELNYPPFSHLLTVRSEEKMEKKAEKGLDEFLTWVASMDENGVIGILGPSFQTVPRKKIKILQCLLKIPKPLFSRFMTHLRAFMAEKSRRLWFDVDPEN